MFSPMGEIVNKMGMSPCGKQHFREIATPDWVRIIRTCTHTHECVRFVNLLTQSGVAISRKCCFPHGSDEWHTPALDQVSTTNQHRQLTPVFDKPAFSSRRQLIPVFDKPAFSRFSQLFQPRLVVHSFAKIVKRRVWCQKRG